MGKRTFVIGADIGGTFTDLVLVEADGRVATAKGLSTPAAYEQGILAILGRLLAERDLAMADCTAVVHGTTVATNAIIERRGARTGLITTAGFRDVLELRRIRIPRLYDLTWEKPEPLVERRLRVEVAERMTHDGRVHAPLDCASVSRAIGELTSEGVESVAVCLLNAHANPDHEHAVGRMLADAAPALVVTLSADLLPEMREYERTSTAVINAYVMPAMRRYIASLTAALAGLGCRVPVLLMQSNGGVMTGELASRAPVHVIESGPAAGVVAAHGLAQAGGIADAVTLDIGGTTAKASLIDEGRLSYASEYEVGTGVTRSGRVGGGGGYVVRSPTIDIAEIGAGGGSIVWVDSGGALQVGPLSAGADPGPACYGRGGRAPTVTDASLVLGYLDQAGLAGGALALDRAAAKAALDAVAAGLGMDATALAHGALQVAVANMTRAIRAVSTERGRDARDLDLIAFGGNGGIFAAAVARELEMPRVVIPPAAGIFSAFGLLLSELEHHFTRTLLGRTDRIVPASTAAAWHLLEQQARQTLAREGFHGEDCRLSRLAELRYVSQTHELAVPWPDGASEAEALREVTSLFEAAHAQQYGHRGHDGMVELVTLHLIARGVSAAPRVPAGLQFPAPTRREQPARDVWFGDGAGWREARVAARDAFGEAPVQGPLIIAEADATIVVPPDFALQRDQFDNIVLRRVAVAGESPA